MNGLPLFNIPETPPKQVADTSREVYSSIVLPNLSERQTMVLKSLDYYIRTIGACPTAYELLEFMRKWKPELDVNNVRPRLSEMGKGDLRFVGSDDRRVCSVKGTPAGTFYVTERGTLFLRSRG